MNTRLKGEGLSNAGFYRLSNEPAKERERESFYF